MFKVRSYSVALILCTLVSLLQLNIKSFANRLATEAHATSDANMAQKYVFGPGKERAGFRQVESNTIYSRESGFGFEPGTSVVCSEFGGNDPLHSSGCAGDKPFFFSVTLPEGNYNVKVTFGDRKAETMTTVRAELRRLMLEQVRTSPGKFETRTFTVNLRTPQISTGGEVKLKDREKISESWAWDEKLTLEFGNRHPAVSAIEITRADVPTLFLLGDSTVCDQPREPYSSWGQMITRFFKAGIAVANNAESGESLRSSLDAKRLDKVLSVMKTGDYLFIQYGHNDEKEKGDGVGAFTTFKASLKQYVEQTRRHGGIPVLITPMNRRTFDSWGKITNSHGDYPEAVRQVANEERVPIIDLNVMSKPFYEALGPKQSKLAFAPGDGTHHDNYGSYELAKCVVKGIRDAKLDLVKYLMPDPSNFDPAKPDPISTFNLPVSSLNTEVKPFGN